MIMKKALSLITIAIAANAFCQDTIAMRDNSKLIAKVLEISSTEIKYKRFDNLNGPDYVISKNDISSITFRNGVKDVFESIIEPTNSTSTYTDNVFVNPTPPKGSVKRETKVGDYIKFNLQAGAIVYNSYSNLPRHESNNWVNGTDEYYSDQSKTTNITPMLGFNALFGNSNYIKALFSLNYLRTRGVFNHQSGHGGYESVYRDFHYKAELDFLNTTTGMRFSIGKRLHLEPLVSFNLVVHTNITRTGYIKTTTYNNYNSYYSETLYYDNVKTNAKEIDIPNTVSLCPRISYTVLNHKANFELYASYNLAYQYRLPWYMFGVIYYPFKKLR